LGRYAPVTASSADETRVPWESWVYTRVGGGIELTFTDESHQMEYDYAPLPLGADLSVTEWTRLARYSPKTQCERAAAVSPDYYVPEYDRTPFDFYFDVADFRGGEDNSLLEVYYGVPRTAGEYVDAADVTRLVVQRQTALVPTTYDTVYRDQDQLIYEVPGRQGAMGGFVPDVVRMNVPPGSYELEVRARNRLNGRLGIYRKSLKVDSYEEDRLQLSDLQLAWSVAEAEAGKFTKNGLQVIPMPTRTYRRSQNVFAYYEVYNLARDEFGRTRYRVEYTIRPTEGPNRGIISRLVQSFTGEEREEVAVGYEQVGMRPSEPTYVELDLSESYAARHRLKVEVTDLNTAKTASREISFRVVD
jgi:hypothetical protein